MLIKRLYQFICLVLTPVLANAQFSDYQLSTLEFVAKGESPLVYSLEELSNAQNALAIRYKEGSGGAVKDYDKAVYWFTKSANNGNRYAQYNLASIYLTGTGVVIDKTKALYWYEKSASQYYHQASLKAGLMYYDGDGTGVDYDKAAKYFKDSAFGGIVNGMYYYASCLAYGRGLKADSTKALLWANRAIENELYDAYNLMGNMYYEGASVHKDYNKAFYYYNKGVQHDLSSSNCNMGILYEFGRGVNKDIHKAIEYYNIAASKGNILAINNLAKLYSNNKNKDYYNAEQASQWFRKLVDKGYDEYIPDLLDAYKTLGNKKGIMFAYEKMASKGDTDALSALAYIYAKGDGTPIDFKAALSYIECAISSAPGNMDYQDSKGEIYTIMGDDKNAKKVWKNILAKQPSYFQKYREEHGYDTEFFKYMKSKGY